MKIERAQFFWLLPLAALVLEPQCHAAGYYTKAETWAASVASTRTRIAGDQLDANAEAEAAHQAWNQMRKDFPVEWEWTVQDSGAEAWRWLLSRSGQLPNPELLSQLYSELGQAAQPFRDQEQKLAAAGVSSADARWVLLYAGACEKRRELRLKNTLKLAPRIIFMKQRTILPSFFAYTEGQSDAQNERHFLPGGQVCLLEFEGTRARVQTLLSDPEGAFRDPAVSWGGDRLLFAWKKALDEDDYHIYEMDPATRAVRQITSGLGFADYEPAWLPNDEIIFASSRCVQTVDCWWTEVSNLYTCDREGNHLRRLGFDQVHAIFPQVLDDGRVIYTRWDYNDRGQIFPQPLFQMFADGTGQTEFYGNNSWFPTTIAHARGIPGTQKVLAMLCGHHSAQVGKLAVIDPAKGRQENSGVQLIAPYRETPAERIDSYGQDGPLWQYPFPITENECLTAYAPGGWEQRSARHGGPDLGLYWMAFDGRRELLVHDDALPCTQPVPLAPRARPTPMPSRVDYARDSGTYYLQDIYAGDSLRGVARGTVKKLRVVALEFRAAGVGNNGSSGPGGGALISTPIAVGNGSWDVKRVLGEATVRPDGSAFFRVPARTPVYFQALDEHGLAVQTMRSWSTLQPGEISGCVGCHEHKNSAPPVHGYGDSLALAAAPEQIPPPGQATAGFSFLREIQPILDHHCIRCHQDRSPIEVTARGGKTPISTKASNHAQGDGSAAQKAFSLLGTETIDPSAKRRWTDSYLVLTGAQLDPAAHAQGSWTGNAQGRVVNWISSQSIPAPLPPYSAGAARSDLIPLLAQGHQGVKLSDGELRRLACWIDLLVPFCGDYEEANAWTPDEQQKYRHYASKRRTMEELEHENIRSLLQAARPKE